MRQARQTIRNYLRPNTGWWLAFTLSTLLANGPAFAFENSDDINAANPPTCGAPERPSEPRGWIGRPQVGHEGHSNSPIFRRVKSTVPDRRVALLQSVLQDKGFYTADVDGVFGAQTTNAVKSFQTALGLTADGIVGVTTGTAMGLPFWEAKRTRYLIAPFRDGGKYPEGTEFTFRSLVGIGNFFSSLPDADYSSSNTLTRRALRTNNPGAINISKWQRDGMRGYVGCTLPDHYGNQTAVYETPEHGVAAWGFLLRKIYFKGKKDKVTVADIIDKYRGENSRDAYIDGYKKYSDGKLVADYQVNLYDNLELSRLAIAAYSHEFGSWYPLTEQQLLAGFSITDGYIDSGVKDEVVVSSEEMDPGRYVKRLDAESPAPPNSKSR